MSNTEDTLQALASLLKGVSEKNKYLESENASLREQINQYKQIIDPIIDWGQVYLPAKYLGQSIPKICLERAKEWDSLRAALNDVLDATEDKGGQFRAWHNHLRQTTKNARNILNQNDKNTIV